MRRALPIAAATLLFAFSAGAQTLQFQPKNSKEPVQVEAENGLEYQQDTKRVIAHGPATATQGDISVSADELIADLRTRPDGGNEVYRVFAQGHVVMKSDNETATGETAVYDFDKAALVLESDPVTLVSPDGTVVAHQALQYWSNEHVAVAEGRAVAEDKNKRKLFGDKIIAFFREDSAPGSTAAKAKSDPAAGVHSKGDISYVQAFGNVRLETAKEIIRGERGDYNIDTGMSTVEGSVKITQNNSQLNGGYAIINVNGGTSRMFGSAAQAGKPGLKQNARVQALIAPHANPDAP